jgi:hypothetical protein
MPIGNTYPARPGGIQGDEILIVFTTDDTYNQTIEEIGVFILSQETDPIFSQWLIDTPPAYLSDLEDYAELDADVSFESVFTNDLNSSDIDRGSDSKMGTGVPVVERKKFKVDVSYSAGDIIATISFVGAYTSFSYYINNKKFTVTASDIAAYTQTAVSSEGVWFFYINQNTSSVDSPIMVLTKTPWGIIDPDVLLWIFYFNASDNTITWIGEERHTYGRDIFQHARNHAQGATYRAGFGASAYNGLTNAQLGSNTDNNFGRALVQIAGGSFYDEDILNSIAHADAAVNSTITSPSTNWDLITSQFLGFTDLATTGTTTTSIVFLSSHTLITGQAITVMQGNTTTIRGTTTITTGGTGTTFTVATVTGMTSGDAIVVGARIPIYYISAVAGSNYTWRKLATTDFLGVSGGVAITTATIASAIPQFNNAVSGGFSNLSSVRFYPVYLMATNFTHEPIIAVLGQGQSTSNNLTNALTEAPFQFSNLVGLSGLSLQEVVPFYRLSFRYDSGPGQNQNRMRLVDATFLNVRLTTVSGSILAPSTGVTNHALLSSLDWSSSGHTGTANKLAAFDVSGVATYSDIVIPLFDATVGAGGDYADIAAAQTAGKYKLKAVGNITMSGDTTLSANIYLDLNGYTMACTTYKFIYATAYTLTITSSIVGGVITFAQSGGALANKLFQSLSDPMSLYVSNITITNQTTVAGNYIALDGIFTNCTINMANVANCGFGSNVSSGDFRGKLYNCNIVGGGAACESVIYNQTSRLSEIALVTFSGTFKSASNVIYCVYGQFRNILYTSATAVRFLVSNVHLLFDAGGKVTIDHTGATPRSIISNSILGTIISRSNTMCNNVHFLAATSVPWINSVNDVTFENCNFASTLAITLTTGYDIRLINCLVTGATTLSADYCKLIGNTFTGAVTISSGSEYNIITENKFTGGLTNSSGNSTNIIQSNI